MITSQSNRQFVEAEIQSDFIYRILHDGLMPSAFWRDVSDFGRGDSIRIPSIGEAEVQELAEDAPFVYNPIETGAVFLQITDFFGDAYYVTDVMRQDGTNVDALLEARAQESTRAIQEHFETRAYATLNAAQTASDLNEVNEFKHRFVASGTNATMELQDLIDLRLAFDKAQVPSGGRVGFVDPVVGATLESKFQGVYNVDSNPVMQGLLEEGYMRDHRAIMDVFGWLIIGSNRLPEVASETIDSVAVTNGVANIFMCVADDNCKPLMVAWRQQAMTEGERNKDRKRDEYVTSSRCGFGAARLDTLGIIITSRTFTS
jgi:hypothetical protein